MRWTCEPTALALAESRWRDPDTLPKPFCLEAGRRLLLAQLEFSEWVLRRVEKVDLSYDRSVSRRIAMEFLVRADAPEFVVPGAPPQRLIPLALMRRRTLVNLDLADGDGRTALLPGLRLTQQLDQAVVLAAAAAVDPALAQQDDVLRFAKYAVAGNFDQTVWAYSTFDAATEGPLAELRNAPVFAWAAERLRHGFTLYTFVPDRPDAAGQQRLMRMSFDEPTEWSYQTPRIADDDGRDGGVLYQPGERSENGLSWFRARMGVDPVRIRLQVPGAERAASYHFEIQAPPGVQIVAASLLAGRPNDPDRHVSEDNVVGHTPVVGLHAIEIPNGSLCRVQVDLGVPLRGWLATILLSAFAVLFVLTSVAWHDTSRLDPDQLTNVIVILVTASAAVATFITQRESGVVATRLVAGLRALSTAMLVLPLLTAGVLTYSGFRKPVPAGIRPTLWIIVGLSAVVALAFAKAAMTSFRAQRRNVIEESPWDQSRFRTDVTPQLRTEPPPASKPNFLTSLRDREFDTPAVGVRSAEAWHEKYFWTDEKQRNAVDALTELGRARTLPETCSGAAACQRPCARTAT